MRFDLFLLWSASVETLQKERQRKKTSPHGILRSLPPASIPRPRGQSVDVKMLPEDGVGRASSRKAEKFKGPSLLATFLYIICFAVAVPVCGISRRCYSRRARGINSAHNGVSDAGGSISLANRRKGWRVSSGTGNRGWEGGNAGSQEGVSLVGEEVDSSARERGV